MQLPPLPEQNVYMAPIQESRVIYSVFGLHCGDTNSTISSQLSCTPQSSLSDYASRFKVYQSALKAHTSEPEMQLQQSLASTSSFVWRIPNVSHRRRDAIEEKITSIYSPPFYTGRNGYKVCIRAFLNGDGSGHTTHLSLFFMLMKGEYDPLLKWPLECKVSMILIDQTHRRHIFQVFNPTLESSSFQRPQTDMNVVLGWPQFTELSVLDDEDYIKENVMFIKCIVDTCNCVRE